MKRIFILFIGISLSGMMLGQGVAISGSADPTPDGSAMLDVQSTDKGMLVPRMNSTGMSGITSPATGLLIYNTDSLAFFYYDGTSWEKVANQSKLGFGSDYAKFEDDGTLVFYGNSTTYEDLQIPGLSTVSKNNAPTLATAYGNIWLYRFDDVGANSENQVYFTAQLPHSWKEGSTIYPHIHYVAEGAGDGDQAVTWGLEYAWANVNGTYPTTTTTITLTDTLSTIADTHLVKGFTGGITPTTDANDRISSILICRLFRNSSNPLDTYPDGVYFLAFDIHFEVNTTGSRTEWEK